MYEELSKYCETEEEQYILEVYCEHLSSRKAAEIVGCGKTKVQNVIAKLRDRAEEAEEIFTVPEIYNKTKESSFFIKQFTSETDGEGNVVRKWTRYEKEKQDYFNFLKEAIREFAETEIPKTKPIPLDHSNQNDDLMVVYPVGDHHIGMLSWGDETGDNHDTEKGESLLMGAMNYLVDKSPSASTALVAILGDFLHYQGDPTTEKSGNVLDTDTRFGNIIRVAMRTLRYLIDSALKKHQTVHLISEIGNHDPYSSIIFAEAMAHIYENEPRVIVNTSPSNFHYLKFGKVLIGTHHGDKVKKPENLALLMATDRSEDWGNTKYRYWYTGHIHNQKVFEFPGCTVESFRILPPVDAYAHNYGYRALRDMKAIIHHKEYGEVGRNTFNPLMLLTSK